MAVNKKSVKNLIPAKKGEVRNPTGINGIKIKPIFEKYLALKCGEEHELTGEELTCYQKAAFQVIKNAMDGDLAAFKEIVDRTEGKPNQSIAVTSTEKDELATMTTAQLKKRAKEIAKRLK